MKIFKVVKTYANDKNMGFQLISINGYTNIFYNFNKKILEFEISNINSTHIEEDIIKYATLEKYHKNDKIMDGFGTKYILHEDIEDINVSRRVSATNIATGKINFYLHL